MSDSQEQAEKWVLPSVDAPAGSAYQHMHSKNTDQKKKAAMPTAKEIETWQKEAREEGYKEGYKQGTQKAQQEALQIKQRLMGLISFLEAPLQSINEDVEKQLNLLAVTLAQQLVRREIREEPGEIIAVIRDAVKLLPAHSRKIRISLNPDDADLVRNTLQLDDHEEDLSWKLIEDPMVTRGGCEIKSEQSSINLTLENRLQSLAAEVFGGERIEDQSDDTSTD